MLILYYAGVPAQFSAIHDVFYVFQLRKCLRDFRFLFLSNLIFTSLLRGCSTFEIKMFLLWRFSMVLKFYGFLLGIQRIHRANTFRLSLSCSIWWTFYSKFLHLVMICSYGCYLLSVYSLWLRGCNFFKEGSL